MLSSVLRQRVVIRSFHSTPVTRSWIGDIFGKKKPAELEPKYKKKDKTEIIKQQDELVEEDTAGKITILGAKNSPDYVEFDIVKELPNFKINSWKKNVVLSKDLEKTYSDKDQLKSLLAETYCQIAGVEQVNEFSKVKLHDLRFRFKLVKELQSVLGFDLNDYQVTKCHNLQALYEEIEGVVNKRWKSERNPNAIVLRPEDFKSSNVYLNQEKDEREKAIKLEQLIEAARGNVNIEVEATKA